MSAASVRRPRRRLVPLALHRELGLIPGWRFRFAGKDTDLTCMCGRPVEFIIAGRGPKAGMCLKHARDF